MTFTMRSRVDKIQEMLGIIQSSPKLTTLTHQTAIQLYLVAESCTICSSRSRLYPRIMRGVLPQSPLFSSVLLCLGTVKMGPFTLTFSRCLYQQHGTQRFENA